ncbi:MAG: hypothetical protein AAGD43_06800 [Pseudomonadota bacterium]
MTDVAQQKIARANAMKHWAEGSGGLFEVFDAIEQTYLTELVESVPEDSAAREAAYHRVRAVRDIRLACETVIQAGKDAHAIVQAHEAQRQKRTHV